MATNRYYYIIGIATGRIPIEESKFELDFEDLKQIERYREASRIAKEKGRKITFYAPESYD